MANYEPQKTPPANDRSSKLDSINAQKEAARKAEAAKKAEASKPGNNAMNDRQPYGDKTGTE